MELALDYSEIRVMHPNRNTNRDWTVLLDGVTTLAQFEKNCKKYAKIAGCIYDLEEEKTSVYNQYVGETFEVFVEVLVKTHGYDRRIGISNYTPINANNGDKDLGVDGYGIGTNGRPATAQAKFRGNPTYLLRNNEDNLSNFMVDSWHRYGVDFNDTENMLIITNCAGLHHFSRDEMLRGKVRCLAGFELRELVDNNIPFWDAMRMLTQPPVITQLLNVA